MTPEETTCPECQKACTSKAGLTRHMNMQHLVLSPSQVSQAIANRQTRES